MQPSTQTINSSDLGSLDKLSLIDVIDYYELHNRSNATPNTITVHSVLSRQHPSQEVQSIQHTKNRIEIYSSILGLLGPHSPLPPSYTQEVREEEDNHINAFYTLINQPHYQNYVHAHQKYRLSDRILKYKQDHLMEIFYSFIGLNGKELNPLQYFSAQQLLEQAPILIHKTRSAHGLTLLLNNLLNLTVTVQEMVCDHHTIESQQQTQLGHTNHQLGEQTHLGDKILYFSGKFTIILEELSTEQFHYFMQGEEGYNKIQEIVGFYMPEEKENYNLSYKLQSYHEGIELGKTSKSILGLNSWLTQAPSYTI